MSKVKQDLVVIIAGVNTLDDLMARILGGSMENQVAENLCVNDVIVSSGLFEVKANSVCTEFVGFQPSCFRAIDGREFFRHDESKDSKKLNTVPFRPDVQ
jgi:hypothetical protein